MPPDDAERSELDEALFSGDAAGPRAGSRPANAGAASRTCRSWMPRCSVRPTRPTNRPTSFAAPAETAPDPWFELEPEIPPVPAPPPGPTAEADSTAVFAAVAAAGGRTATLRSSRAANAGAAPDAAERLAVAALVVVLVAGLGGLAYAALGRNDDGSPKKPNGRGAGHRRDAHHAAVDHDELVDQHHVDAVDDHHLHAAAAVHRDGAGAPAGGRRRAAAAGDRSTGRSYPRRPIRRPHRPPPTAPPTADHAATAAHDHRAPADDPEPPPPAP